MKRMRWIVGLGGAAAVVLLAVALVAQNAPINVYGNVNDKDGRPQQGVTVSFMSADNGQSLGTATTDARGYYTKTIGLPGNKNGYFVTPSGKKVAFEPKRAKATKSGRIDFVQQTGKGTK